VQEGIDLTVLAFDLADRYRTICVVLVDGSIGQMMEPAELPDMRPIREEVPDWATDGAKGRKNRLLSSIYLNPVDQEQTNIRLLNRYQEIEENEIRYKEYYLDDAEFVVVGFGTAGRVALSAVRTARAQGIKVGLLRPVTLRPFPSKVLAKLAGRVRSFLVVEMNSGQMLDDVRLAVNGLAPVEFYGRMGGVVPLSDEILEEIKRNANRPMSFRNGHVRAVWLDRLSELHVNEN
jgi:2-oxoglutarate ferredoxin oxidoreductase subunit alpha